jgi:hypothetical protein
MERIDINQAIHNDTPIIRWSNDSNGILCDHYFTSNISNSDTCYKHGRHKFKIEVGGELIGLKGETLCCECVEDVIQERENKYTEIKENRGGALWWFSAVALLFALYTCLIFSLYYTMQSI